MKVRPHTIFYWKENTATLSSIKKTVEESQDSGKTVRTIFLFWNVQAWKLKQICDKENSKILSASVVWITPWFWHLHTPRINQQVRAKLFCFDRFSHDNIVFMPLHSSVFKVQKDPFHNPFIFSRNYVHLFSWNYND